MNAADEPLAELSVRQRNMSWAILPVLFYAAVIAILIAGGNSAAEAIKAALLLCAASLPATAFFGPRPVFRDFPLFLTTASLGLIWLGCVGTLAIALNQSPELWIGVVLAGGLVVSTARLFRGDNAPLEAGSTDISATTLKIRIGAFAAAILLGSVMFVYGFQMGRGPYPLAFYGVDNPYHLGIVRSFITSDLFPPQSLDFVGRMGPYHYAMLDAAAMVSRISGLPAHASYFIFCLFVLTIGTLALCWLIARKIANGWFRVVLMALIYLGTFHQNSLQFVKHFLPALHAVFSYDQSDVSQVELHFGHIVTRAGMVLALLVIYLMLYRQEKWAKVLLVLIIGFAPIVKVLHFIAFCIWLGAVSLIGFLLEKPWRMSPRDAILSAIWKFLPVISAYILGMVIMRIAGFSQSERQLVFGFFPDANVSKGVRATFEHAAILFLPAAICLFITRGRALRRDLLFIAGLALAPLAFVSVTALTIPGIEETDYSWFQVAAPAAIGITMIAGLLVSRAWPALGTWHRAVVAIVFILSCGTQLLRFPLMATDTAIHLDHGSEVMDNRDVAKALQAIPVDGSLVVANDLRNPAENYKRPDLQTQVPAIFGQQFFLAAPTYNHEAPDFAAKKAAQELLQSSHWQESISDAAKQYGWSHFLVHKSVPYPADIPLKKIYDSDSYAVYQF